MEGIQVLPALKDIEINGQTFKVHADVNPEKGGIKIVDEESKFSVAIQEIGAKIAKKALKGQLSDLISTPSPAYIHYPYTHLNLRCCNSQYVNYLTKAASVSDPLEKMNLVSAYCIAGLYVSSTLMQLRVPVNPILGETIQREMSTGEKVYCEQISHHPPITAFQITGPNGEYEHYGSYQFKGWLNGMQSIGGTKNGIETIKFKDGTVYTLPTNPTLSTEGLIAGSGSRHIYYDKAIVIDQTNQLTAEITFNPNYDNSYKAMGGAAAYAAVGGAASIAKAGLGMLWGGSKKPKEEKKEKDVKNEGRADEISYVIKKNADDSVLAQGNGSWLSHLEVEGNVVWRIDQELPVWEDRKQTLSDGDIILNSDSAHRNDIVSMISKTWDQADKDKLELEELQRHDAKLRKEAQARRDAQK